MANASTQTDAMWRRAIGRAPPADVATKVAKHIAFTNQRQSESDCSLPKVLEWRSKLLDEWLSADVWAGPCDDVFTSLSLPRASDMSAEFRELCQKYVLEKCVTTSPTS